jgi:pectate lyase
MMGSGIGSTRFQGYGATTPGGSGGETITVTNLNDSGDGSLRSACSRGGARVIKFDVAGTIELSSFLDIENPYITISGEIAPGGGVCLKNWGLRIATHDVVVRYFRSRPGPQDGYDTGQNDAILIDDGSENILIDHCSLSWATDEVVSISANVRNVTICWCMIYEGLMYSTHPAGLHSMGSLITGGESSTTEKISLHHNLYAMNNQRNPRVINVSQLQAWNNLIDSPNEMTEFIGVAQADMIKNVYFPTGLEPDKAEITGEDAECFLLGNWGVDGKPGAQTDLIDDEDIDLFTILDSSSCPTLRPSHQPSDVQSQVLDNAGATLPKRDAADIRIVEQTKNGIRQRINDPTEVGGWPDLTG